MVLIESAMYQSNISMHFNNIWGYTKTFHEFIIFLSGKRRIILMKCLIILSIDWDHDGNKSGMFQNNISRDFENKWGCTKTLTFIIMPTPTLGSLEKLSLFFE
jgi:hypothetical protein